MSLYLQHVISVVWNSVASSCQVPKLERLCVLLTGATKIVKEGDNKKIRNSV